MRLQRSAVVHLLLLIHRVAFLSCLGEGSFQKIQPPKSTYQLRILWVLRSKEPSCNAGDAGNLGSIPGSGRSPGGGHGKPTPAFLPGESQGQRSLAGYSPWGHKESDTTEATEHTRTAYIIRF